MKKLNHRLKVYPPINTSNPMNKSVPYEKSNPQLLSVPFK